MTFSEMLSLAWSALVWLWNHCLVMVMIFGTPQFTRFLRKEWRAIVKALWGK